MSKICVNCGAVAADNTLYCQNCGAALPPANARPQYSAPQYGAPVYCGNGAVRTGIPAPGFSDRAYHPEILAAVKKNRKASKIFALVLVPLPLLGFVIYSLASDKMELGKAAMYGGIVSAVFLVFALISFIRGRAKNSYEAVVVDQTSRLTHRHANSDDDSLVTEYVTVVKTADGKKKKIVEWEGSQIWAHEYLNVGDRFRYHPQFIFPYKLYDKTRAPYIACVGCGRKNEVASDRCGKCNLPLLK